MQVGLEKSALFKWVKARDGELAARVLQIRSEVSKWLPQVTQLFPHYPSHALDHSDRIVFQLSRLLFSEAKPCISFSPIEVYCLLCSVYLHDIGMVVPPSEVVRILSSAQWKEYVAPDGNGNHLYVAYERARRSADSSGGETSAFLADRLLRFILADFVRRDHHERGRTVLEMHAFLRQLVDDGDSVAFQTISDIGVAHGLDRAELSDESRFPEERDVVDGKVNVRFLARLLRIGDLLDMSTSRADPMTASSIGPLPPDAVPHWRQYSSKKHENITPEIIEFTFECEDQDTHRVLRDWFGWLEEEVHTAGLEQLHSKRHSDWKAPHCLIKSQASSDSIDCVQKPTIIIRPRKNASYRFHDWKLELDHELVLQRLIYDVYEEPAVFVRELIQNASDATRCQMYSDYAVAYPGYDLPTRPTQFPAEFRALYPISIHLTFEDVSLTADGPTERRLIVTIEDRGTGMNEEIIRRYFLQVGRSYYQSNEFRENYKFAPTSRFGVGFLSVFAVSRDVTVETARHDDQAGKLVGIRLKLREPKNYLLTESWCPGNDPETCRPGTRVRVVLDDPDVIGSLTAHIRGWCVAVEVPVLVFDDDQKVTRIHAKRLADGEVLAASRTTPEAEFLLRTFDVDSPAVEGQVAVIAYKDNAGEAWCDVWSDEKDLGGERIDTLPTVARSYVALHGMVLERPYAPGSHSQWISQCDVRSETANLSLARTASDRTRQRNWRAVPAGVGISDASSLAARAVHETVAKAVELHFSETPRCKRSNGIYYVGRVLSEAPLSDLFRDQYPSTVITWGSGERDDISVSKLQELTDLIIIGWPQPYGRSNTQPQRPHPRDFQATVPIISPADIPMFARGRFWRNLVTMNLHQVENTDGVWMLHFSSSTTNTNILRVPGSRSSWVSSLDLDGLPMIRLDSSGSGIKVSVVNVKNEVAAWVLRLSEVSTCDPMLVSPEHVEALWKCMIETPYSVKDLAGVWMKSSSVPEDLKPPLTDRALPPSFGYETITSYRTLSW